MSIKQYSYTDISIGHAESFEVKVTEEMMKMFCQISGDVNPLHCDSEFARSKGYRDKVAYGMLTATFLSTLAGVWLPGEKSLIHSRHYNIHNARFLESCYIRQKIEG